MSGRKARKLHESTSRAMCRLGFIVLAVMPLVACTLMAVAQWTPVYQSWLRGHYEGVLTARLGFPVSIASVETLSPYRTRFGEVRVQDPENGAEVARAGLVVLSTAGASTQIKIFGAKLPARSSDKDRLRLSWQTIHDAFLCRPSEHESRASVLCDRISVGHFVLDQVRLDVSSQREQTLAKVQFAAATRDQLAASQDDQQRSTSALKEVTQIELLRRHGGEERATEIVVRFPDGGLDVALAARVFPGVQRLGSSAIIEGEFGAFQRGEAAWGFCCGESLWSGQFLTHLLPAATRDTGQHALEIRNVDYGTLCWTSPLDLAGSGKLMLQDVLYNPEHEFQAFHIRTEISEGRIGCMPLQQAEKFVGIKLSPDLLGVRRGDLAFDKAVWQFKIDSQSALLHVWGYFADGIGEDLDFIAWNEGWTRLNEVVAMLQHSDAQRENHSAQEADIYTHWVAEFARCLPLDQAEAALRDKSLRLSKTQSSPNY